MSCRPNPNPSSPASKSHSKLIAHICGDDGVSLTDDGLLVLRTSNGAVVGLASNCAVELHRWRIMNQAMFDAFEQRDGEVSGPATAPAPRRSSPYVHGASTQHLPQQQQQQPGSSLGSHANSGLADCDAGADGVVRDSGVPPLNDRVAHLEHALALHEAASAATGAHYPVDCIKFVMRRFRPVCYICTLMVPEDSETRMCYVCGLSWWSRFESALEQHALVSGEHMGEHRVS